MKPTALAGAAALALLFAAPTQAEAPAAGDDVRLSLAYDGKLYVKILSVELEQTAGKRGFQSKLRVLAQGPLALFKKLDVIASSRGSVDRGAAKPETFNYVSKSGAKQRSLTEAQPAQMVEAHSLTAEALPALAEDLIARINRIG